MFQVLKHVLQHVRRPTSLTQSENLSEKETDKRVWSFLRRSKTQWDAIHTHLHGAPLPVQLVGNRDTFRSNFPWMIRPLLNSWPSDFLTRSYLSLIWALEPWYCGVCFKSLWALLWTGEVQRQLPASRVLRLKAFFGGPSLFCSRACSKQARSAGEFTCVCVHAHTHTEQPSVVTHGTSRSPASHPSASRPIKRMFRTSSQNLPAEWCTRCPEW